uniref:Centromere protein W n=1 Tax=Otus sunia TaxID=257818 RepID=A0A8C8BHC0_9STRI
MIISRALLRCKYAKFKLYLPESCSKECHGNLMRLELNDVHLSFLLFLHRLAEEARTNAFENKSKIIKPEHAIAAAKVIKHF